VVVKKHYKFVIYLDISADSKVLCTPQPLECWKKNIHIFYWN